MLFQTKKRAADLFVPGTSQSDKADHFAATDAEINRSGFAGRKGAGGQKLEAILNLRTVNATGFPTDDQADQVFGVGMSDIAHPDHLAVAQNCDPVRNLKNFVQTVRDIDHADTFGTKRAKRCKQTLHLVSGKAGGRLVQNKEITFNRQGAGDGNKRFFGPGQA